MSDQDETREGSRIAKVMARAGLCSRRDAEQWITQGRVSVNGEVLTSPAFNVSAADDIRVDGEPLRAAERTRLFLFHKPRGLVTTARDPEGRPTLFDALPADLPRVVAVGRLDINTEGLLLLTNDGGLARVLELPATGWLRRYRVRAHGEVRQDQLDALKGGVTIDGVDYLGIDAKFERQQGSNVWLTMGLREGKNREIKRVLEHMGLSVNRLIRVSFGPFELGDLAEGEVAEVRTRVLRDQLGPKLAKQAGADFDAPVEAAAAPEPARRPRAERPSREPPRGDQPVRKRKHVSVLRAEAREEAAGPRKRVTRATTADRKGREVQIERVSLAKPAPERPFSPKRRAPGEGSSRDHAPRRAPARGGEGGPGGDARPRRDGPPRDAARAFRPREARSDDAAPRRERPPRREGAVGSEAPPPHRFRDGAPGRDARPRREGPPRDAARPFRPREARGESEGAERRTPRRFGEGAPGRDARPRREGPARDAARPFRPREARGESEGAEGRPPRRFGEGAPSHDARPRREGPPRDAARPFRPREARGESEGAEGRPPRRFGEGAPSHDARPRREGPPRDAARPFRPREARAESEGAEGRTPRRFGEGAPGRDARPRREGPPRDAARPFRPREARGEEEATRDGAPPPRRPSRPGARPSGPRPGGKPRGGRPGGKPPR